VGKTRTGASFGFSSAAAVPTVIAFLAPSLEVLGARATLAPARVWAACGGGRVAARVCACGVGKRARASGNRRHNERRIPRRRPQPPSFPGPARLGRQGSLPWRHKIVLPFALSGAKANVAMRETPRDCSTACGLQTSTASSLGAPLSETLRYGRK